MKKSQQSLLIRWSICLRRLLGRYNGMWLMLAACAFGISADDTGPGFVGSLERFKNWTGDQIAESVNNRDDGHQVARSMTIELISKNGEKRTQRTKIYRKDFEDARRMCVFYEEPANVRGTAFLNIDYLDPNTQDVRWLYMPVTRRPRRIAIADRGQYFLGTDLAYEDINHETNLNMKDYVRRHLQPESLGGIPCLKLEGVPVNNDITKELNYGKVISWVDPVKWMVLRTDYWDAKGELLKTITYESIEKIQGIWTAKQLHVNHHQTGHRTIFYFEKIDYQTEMDDGLFTTRSLSL